MLSFAGATQTVWPTVSIGLSLELFCQIFETFSEILYDSLDGGSACRKASTTHTTAQHKDADTHL
jgi:hypothetical protein